MQTRIYGLENEYRVVRKPEAQEDYAELLMRDPELHHGFAANGAKIYLDRTLPEYATPECSNALDLITCENAGNRLIFKKLKTAAHILKSSRGWDGYTSGCHENYLIDSEVVPRDPSGLVSTDEQFKTLSHLLTTFLVSRQILCGAGKIQLMIEGGAKYHISQRGGYISTVLGMDTVNYRSIINTRPKPYAGADYFRLHLILGDSNLSEVSTLLKVGTTGIVLRMIEAKFLRQAPLLGDPVSALHQISEDPSCAALVESAYGRKATAVNLQQWYLEKGLRFFEDEPSTNEEKMILKIWQETLDKLKRDPMECDREIDWVIKKRIIEQYQERTGLPLENEQVRTIDYLYHHLDPGVGIFQKLVRLGKVRRLVTDKEVERAMLLPPQDTRAKLRGELVKAVLEHPAYGHRIFIDSWDSVIWSPDTVRTSQITITLEPLETENKQIRQLIERIKQRG